MADSCEQKTKIWLSPFPTHLPQLDLYTGYQAEKTYMNFKHKLVFLGLRQKTVRPPCPQPPPPPPPPRTRFDRLVRYVWAS